MALHGEISAILEIGPRSCRAGPSNATSSAKVMVDVRRRTAVFLALAVLIQVWCGSPRASFAEEVASSLRRWGQDFDSIVRIVFVMCCAYMRTWCAIHRQQCAWRIQSMPSLPSGCALRRTRPPGTSSSLTNHGSLPSSSEGSPSLLCRTIRSGIWQRIMMKTIAFLKWFTVVDLCWAAVFVCRSEVDLVSIFFFNPGVECPRDGHIQPVPLQLCRIIQKVASPPR